MDSLFSEYFSVPANIIHPILHIHSCIYHKCCAFLEIDLSLDKTLRKKYAAWMLHTKFIMSFTSAVRAQDSIDPLRCLLDQNHPPVSCFKILLRAAISYVHCVENYTRRWQVIVAYVMFAGLEASVDLCLKNKN